MSLVINTPYNSIWSDRSSIRIEADSQFNIDLWGSVAPSAYRKIWDGNIFYSYDNKNWMLWDGNQSLTSNEDGVVYLCGENNTYLSLQGINNGVNGAGWRFSKDVKWYGDIGTLLDFRKKEEGLLTELPEKACYCMFVDLSHHLLIPPTLNFQKINASGCRLMFVECTRLQAIPKLEARYLTNYCYRQMFYGCNVSIGTGQTEERQNVYRIPFSNNYISTGSASCEYMFSDLEGEGVIINQFTPSLNTTYYVDKVVIG